MSRAVVYASRAADPSDVPGHTYRAYDLTIASPLALPELLPAEGEPDVVLRYGAVPVALEQPVLRRVFYQIGAGGDWLITAEQVAGARFLIRHGNTVTVERVQEAGDDVLRLFLLGSCMGALLMQRGLIPLHANAVVARSGAVAIGGGVGAGKSTLTTVLHRRGYAVLADDVVAMRVGPGQLPRAMAGFPRLKLWADTLDRLGLNASGLRRIRPELEKYEYPLADAFCPESQPLTAIYMLTPAPVARPGLKVLKGMQKLRELQAHLYKIRFEDAQRIWPWLFTAATAVAERVRVCAVERPRHGFCLDELADLVEADLRV